MTGDSMTEHTPQPHNRSQHELELLSGYLDEQITDDEHATLEQRLQDDAALRNELEELRATVTLLHHMAPVSPPRSFTLDPALAKPARPFWSNWLLPVGSVAVLLLAVTITVVYSGMLSGSPVASTPSDFSDQAESRGLTTEDQPASEDASESLASSPFPSPARTQERPIQAAQLPETEDVAEAEIAETDALEEGALEEDTFEEEAAADVAPEHEMGEQMGDGDEHAAVADVAPETAPAPFEADEQEAPVQAERPPDGNGGTSDTTAAGASTQSSREAPMMAEEAPAQSEPAGPPSMLQQPSRPGGDTPFAAPTPAPRGTPQPIAPAEPTVPPIPGTAPPATHEPTRTLSPRSEGMAGVAGRNGDTATASEEPAHAGASPHAGEDAPAASSQQQAQAQAQARQLTMLIVAIMVLIIGLAVGVWVARARKR